jgi:hypothetical protein
MLLGNMGDNDTHCHMFCMAREMDSCNISKSNISIVLRGQGAQLRGGLGGRDINITYCMCYLIKLYCMSTYAVFAVTTYVNKFNQG